MFKHIFKDAPRDTFARLEASAFGQRTYIQAPLMAVDTETLLGTLKSRANIFFAPAVHKTEEAGRESVWGSRVLWADIDDTDIPPVPSFPPSFVVSSGHGFHLYWLLEGWHTEIKALEQANKLLAEDVNGDRACWNANRLLRVPGSINSKSGKEEVACELWEAHPTRTYKLADFRVLKALSEDTRKLMRTDGHDYASRSERDWHVIRGLLEAGASDDLVHTLAWEGAWGTRVRDEHGGERYLETTLRKAQESVGREKAESEKAEGRGKGGIVEADNSYWAVDGRGTLHRLSTFVFEPRLLLEHPDEQHFVGQVKAAGTEQTWDNITFSRSAFNSHASLSRELKVMAWSWVGPDRTVRELLPYLLGRLREHGTPTVRATSVLGRHEDLIVGVKHVLSKDRIYTRDDAPLVFLDAGRERPDFLAGELPQGEPDPHVLDAILALNRPEVIYPILAWFGAAPYKTVLDALGVRFPVLDCFGTRGSGKTSTLGVMHRLFGSQPHTYDANTTPFVQLTLLGSSNSVPVSFSEFRASTTNHFTRRILMAYDEGRDARGRADQTTQTYPLSAPFTVDGEDMVSDAAAKERIIAVNLHPEDLTHERKEAMDALRRSGSLDTFAIPYLQRSLCADLPAMWGQAERDYQKHIGLDLPHRVRNNITVLVFGLRALGLEIPDGAFDESIRWVWDVEKARTSMLVDDFVEALVLAAARQEHTFEHRVRAGGKQLWFGFSAAHAWWVQLKNRMRSELLGRDALLIQMQERMGEGPGQYMIPPTALDSRMMYGVDLKRAHTAGLDVPERINRSEITLSWED